jgi:hypothetical protein
VVFTTYEPPTNTVNSLCQPAAACPRTRMTLLISGNRSLGQRGFRFGILDGIVNSRLPPTVLAQASYLTAAATPTRSGSVIT